MSGSRAREVALVSALVLGVTSGGVAIGAFGLSPLLGDAPMLKLRSLGDQLLGRVFELAAFVAGNPELLVIPVAAVVGVVALKFVTRSKRKRGQRRNTTIFQAPSAFSSRTPKDVQVLAAAGQAPADIAVRTRMSVDAVSMLLQLGKGEVTSTAL